MSKISVVIITLNEEKNIERCLKSIQGVADEVIIIDSGSKDKTIEIAAKYSAIVLKKEWMGYSGQKNYGNAAATNDIILSLDADESLSDELKNNILEIKKNDIAGVYGFSRLTNYCGTFVKHGGWYPDFKIRIFNRKKVSWSGHIHENLIGFSQDEIKALQGDCLHYSYYSEEEHWKQAEKFSILAAEDLYNRGKKSSVFKLFFSPMVRFVSGYFLKLGFLDGRAGFKIAYISSVATKIKYQKLNELWNK